jgi:hypothetical protein
MKREEAIERIKTEKALICGGCTHPQAIGYCENTCKLPEALDMAIEALENEPVPCEKCIHVKSCRKVILLKNRTYRLVKYCSQGAERKEP